MEEDKKEFKRRRLFFKYGNDFFKIFNFEQNPDGSIYISWPKFQETIWQGYHITTDGPRSAQLNTVGDGKLSIHGTGMATFRAHSDSEGHTQIIKGSILREQNKVGIRHLFTALIPEPFELPASGVFNRASDFAIKLAEPIKPFVSVFYAIPRTGLNYKFGMSLNIDELENMPNDMLLGFGNFPLLTHDILWHFYRTKNMNNWSKKTLVCYDDGYKVPIFIGIGEGTIRLEYRKTKYSIINNELIIDC